MQYICNLHTDMLVSKSRNSPFAFDFHFGCFFVVLVRSAIFHFALNWVALLLRWLWAQNVANATPTQSVI